jgi:hypothetical protein
MRAPNTLPQADLRATAAAAIASETAGYNDLLTATKNVSAFVGPPHLRHAYANMDGPCGGSGPPGRKAELPRSALHLYPDAADPRRRARARRLPLHFEITSGDFIASGKDKK